MVGNNTPIFFVRDPMKFQHFIRSQKRRADNGLRDHDMQWDFWTLSPESAHMVTWLMGDRGIPETYRYMNGIPATLHVGQRGRQQVLGQIPLQDQPGNRVPRPGRGRPTCRREPDYHRQDLFEAIREGDFPSWTLSCRSCPSMRLGTSLQPV